MAEFVQSEITAVDIGDTVFTNPEDLEKWWDDYCKAPKDDHGNIKKSFLWWSPGTDDRKICKWFDKNYPDGLLGLMKKRQVRIHGEDNSRRGLR